MILGRRALLSLGGLLATGAVAACAAEPAPARNPRPVPAPAPARRAVIRTETAHSIHRGTDVQLMLAHPAGLESTEGLPIVLYLHGRDGMNPVPIPYGTLDALQPEFDAGRIPPFGLLAVDGGYNAYWTDGSANGDLLRMLMEEVPAWLRERRLGGADGLPFACAGVSTGGFGALHYAIERVRAGIPPAAAAVLAPALAVSWEVMRTKNAFATEQDWAAVDPLRRIDELGDVPVGVWIGDADPFLEGAQRLVQQHPNTPVFAVRPGGHDGSVFDAVGAEMLAFLAEGAPVAS